MTNKKTNPTYQKKYPVFKDDYKTKTALRSQLENQISNYVEFA